jgi:hypothetical protein
MLFAPLVEVQFMSFEDSSGDVGKGVEVSLSVEV